MTTNDIMTRQQRDAINAAIDGLKSMTSDAEIAFARWHCALLITHSPTTGAPLDPHINHVLALSIPMPANPDDSGLTLAMLGTMANVGEAYACILTTACGVGYAVSRGTHAIHMRQERWDVARVVARPVQFVDGRPAYSAPDWLHDPNAPARPWVMKRMKWIGTAHRDALVRASGAAYDYFHELGAVIQQDGTLSNTRRPAAHEVN